MQLAQVIVFVKDLERMLAFYRDVIGLVPLDHSDGRFVRLDGGGTRIALHRLPDGVAARVRVEDPPIRRTYTPVKLAFHADDVDVVRAGMEARGVTCDEVRRFGAVAFFDVVDPEGNIVQVTTR